MTVWLLQHKQIIQLHTYVYIVPTMHTGLDNESSLGMHGGVTTDHTPTLLAGKHGELSDSGSNRSSADGLVDVVKAEELLVHLSLDERRSILSTSAAADEDDLEEFARYHITFALPPHE